MSAELVGLIPAAGRGVRAYPYTRWVPKSMLEVDGVPLVQRNVELLRDQLDVREIVVVVGYRGEVIRRASRRRPPARRRHPLRHQRPHRPRTSPTRSTWAPARSTVRCCMILADECYIGSNHRDLLAPDLRAAAAVCGIIESESREADPQELRRHHPRRPHRRPRGEAAGGARHAHGDGDLPAGARGAGAAPARLRAAPRRRPARLDVLAGRTLPRGPSRPALRPARALRERQLARRPQPRQRARPRRHLRHPDRQPGLRGRRRERSDPGADPGVRQRRVARRGAGGRAATRAPGSRRRRPIPRSDWPRRRHPTCPPARSSPSASTARAATSSSCAPATAPSRRATSASCWSTCVTPISCWVRARRAR